MKHKSNPPAAHIQRRRTAETILSNIQLFHNLESMSELAQDDAVRLIARLIDAGMVFTERDCVALLTAHDKITMKTASQDWLTLAGILRRHYTRR
jgi:hypothetical protein